MNASLAERPRILKTVSRTTFVGFFTLGAALGGTLSTLVLFHAQGGLDLLTSSLLGLNGGGATGVVFAGLVALIAGHRVTRVPGWTAGTGGAVFGAIAAPLAFLGFMYALWTLAT